MCNTNQHIHMNTPTISQKQLQKVCSSSIPESLSMLVVFLLINNLSIHFSHPVTHCACNLKAQFAKHHLHKQQRHLEFSENMKTLQWKGTFYILSFYSKNVIFSTDILLNAAKKINTTQCNKSAWLETNRLSPNHSFTALLSSASLPVSHRMCEAKTRLPQFHTADGCSPPPLLTFLMTGICSFCTCGNTIGLIYNKFQN